MNKTKTKILIVEDEKIIAIDIRNTLRKLGYDVVGIVGNGKDAIILAEKENPDLILMDIMLKGDMTGIQAAETITKMRNVPIVYLTALVDSETLEKAKITEPYGYLVKPFDDRGLHSTIEMAIYKHSIEAELKRKTLELEKEKERTDELLHNILPTELVKELKETGRINPRHYNMTSILFTNFYGFTDITSSLTPNILLRELNDIFNNFDTIIEKFKLEKLKTIGGTYMIVGGLPKESDDHAVKIVSAALEMQSFIENRNNNSKLKWQMKAGINSGQVVAGIVGTNKFTYDVWGDAVNIASRMESSSEPGKINISAFTYNLIKDYFECEYRGKLNAKGKGEVDMYYVLRPIYSVIN